MTDTLRIQIEAMNGVRVPRTHVMERMRHALERVRRRPIEARVVFADVNGPKGGADIRCLVLVALPGQPALRVEAVAAPARVAFDDACDRLVRRLHRAAERWRELGRRPKKYYVAQRLE